MQGGKYAARCSKRTLGTTVVTPLARSQCLWRSFSPFCSRNFGLQTPSVR